MKRNRWFLSREQRSISLHRPSCGRWAILRLLEGCFSGRLWAVMGGYGRTFLFLLAVRFRGDGLLLEDSFTAVILCNAWGLRRLSSAVYLTARPDTRQAGSIVLPPVLSYSGVRKHNSMSWRMVFT